jgi:hypothetical protein
MLSVMPDLATVLAGAGVLDPSVGGPRRDLLATGLVDLDRLLGGGLSGKVLLTGLPGRGRSVLATQFALTAARAGRSVSLFTPQSLEECLLPDGFLVFFMANPTNALVASRQAGCLRQGERNLGSIAMLRRCESSAAKD